MRRCFELLCPMAERTPKKETTAAKSTHQQGQVSQQYTDCRNLYNVDRPICLGLEFFYRCCCLPPGFARGRGHLIERSSPQQRCFPTATQPDATTQVATSLPRVVPSFDRKVVAAHTLHTITLSPTALHKSFADSTLNARDQPRSRMKTHTNK